MTGVPVVIDGLGVPPNPLTIAGPSPCELVEAIGAVLAIWVETTTEGWLLPTGATEPVERVSYQAVFETRYARSKLTWRRGRWSR